MAISWPWPPWIHPFPGSPALRRFPGGAQGEDLRQRQQLPQATHLAREELFTAAAAQFGEELQDLKTRGKLRE